jgi:GT2 family glycosyltransferase
MSATPEISIVIVNWNTCELLRNCLRSLKADLEGGLCEVIVVDNGSVDGSADMVAGEFPSVRLIANADNRGFTAATNQGHEIARGVYVLMLNSDTELVDPAALRRCIDFLEANPDVGVLGCRIVYPDGSPQNSYFRFPSLRAVLLQASFLQQLFERSRLFNWDRYGDETFTEPRDVDCVMGGFLMLRKRAISENPLLDEGYFMYAEEADLCYRLKSRGWRVVFYPGATVSHHSQASSGRNPRTAAWADEAKQRGRLRFIRKWRGPIAAYFANLIILIGLLPRAVGWLVADTIAALRSSQNFAPRSVLKARSLRFHSAVLFRPSRLYSSWAPAALDPRRRD